MVTFLFLQALNGNFVTDSRDNNLPVMGNGSAVNGEEVVLEDARIDHAVTANTKEIVCSRGKQIWRDGAVIFDVLLREDRATCCHLTDNGDAEFFRKTDATRSAGNDFNGAFSRQCLEMFFRRIGRSEPQLLGNICPRRRVACVFNMAFDKFENLSLSGS